MQSRAPRQLKDAFDSVLRAEVTRGKVHQDALDYENQVLLKASGEAKAYVETARSERAMLVKEVTGDAQRFKDLLPKYRANPALFAQQRLTETLGRVFTNAQDKIFITDAAGSPRELRLLLNRDAPKKKTEEPTP